MYIWLYTTCFGLTTLHQTILTLPTSLLCYTLTNAYNWRPDVSKYVILRGCRVQLFVHGKLVRLFTMFVSSIKRGNMVLTLRGKAINTATHGSCAQLIHTLTEL
jgi:hypothetical protein